MPKKPVKTLVEPGAIIDGFTIGQCVHRGGMATLWSVTRPDSNTSRPRSPSKTVPAVPRDDALNRTMFAALRNALSFRL
jgi:hypothetical protein